MGIQILSETKAGSTQETYDQIMFEIQKRMVDIESNRDQKKPIHNEIGDMVALINKLSDVEGVDSSVIKERQLAVSKLFK